MNKWTYTDSDSLHKQSGSLWNAVVHIVAPFINLSCFSRPSHACNESVLACDFSCSYYCDDKLFFGLIFFPYQNLMHLYLNTPCAFKILHSSIFLYFPWRYARQVAEFFEFVKKKKEFRTAEMTDGDNKSINKQIVLPRRGGLWVPGSSPIPESGLKSFDFRRTMSSFLST